MSNRYWLFLPDNHLWSDVKGGRKDPQIQLFVRIRDYQGGEHIMADGQSEIFHVDFFSGWEEGVLQDIIDNCPVLDGPYSEREYNPPCNCEDFLTKYEPEPVALCDDLVKNFILNEEYRMVSDGLPRGTCSGPSIIPKTWTTEDPPPVDCFLPPPQFPEDLDIDSLPQSPANDGAPSDAETTDSSGTEPSETVPFEIPQSLIDALEKLVNLVIPTITWNNDLLTDTAVETSFLPLPTGPTNALDANPNAVSSVPSPGGTTLIMYMLQGLLLLTTCLS